MSLHNTPNIQRYAKGDVIISEGIISNNAYLVIEGKVQVTKKVNRKTVIISNLSKGDVFGEMGLITPALRSANVVATEDTTIGVIDRESFAKYLDALPGDMKILLKVLVDRLRSTTQQLSQLGVHLAEMQASQQSTRKP